MADTDLDDGDMARLLARTADMLKQVRWGLRGCRAGVQCGSRTRCSMCVLGPMRVVRGGCFRHTDGRAAPHVDGCGCKPLRH
jgi:hypothetical protein